MVGAPPPLAHRHTLATPDSFPFLQHTKLVASLVPLHLLVHPAWGTGLSPKVTLQGGFPGQGQQFCGTMDGEEQRWPDVGVLFNYHNTDRAAGDKRDDSERKSASCPGRIRLPPGEAAWLQERRGLFGA